MKFRFWCDIPQNRKPGDHLIAQTFAGPKKSGATRIQFDVTVGDWLLNRVDDEVMVEKDAEEWTPGASA